MIKIINKNYENIYKIVSNTNNDFDYSSSEITPINLLPNLNNNDTSNNGNVNDNDTNDDVMRNELANYLRNEINI